MQKVCEDSKKVKKQALVIPFCPPDRFSIARTSSEGGQHALASPGYCSFRPFLSDLRALVLFYELICWRAWRRLQSKVPHFKGTHQISNTSHMKLCSVLWRRRGAT